MVGQEVQGVVETQQTEPAPVNDAIPDRPIPPHWLRLGLAFEFLMALIAVTVTWDEIAGQGHMDLIPWHLKFVLIGGVCWAFVRFSAALTRPGKWRNPRSLGWLLATLALVAAMGLVTLYFHMHEPADNPDEDTPGTSVSIPHQPATGAHL
jgi:hypothetical protein